MIKSLKVLKMLLFLGFLKNLFLKKELREYIELKKDKLNYIWINEYEKWLKKYRKVSNQVRMISWKITRRKKDIKIRKTRFK